MKVNQLSQAELIEALNQAADHGGCRIITTSRGQKFVPFSGHANNLVSALEKFSPGCRGTLEKPNRRNNQKPKSVVRIGTSVPKRSLNIVGPAPSLSEGSLVLPMTR